MNLEEHDGGGGINGFSKNWKRFRYELWRVLNFDPTISETNKSISVPRVWPGRLSVDTLTLR